MDTMSTLELKNKVIERLKSIKEDYLLEEILNLIDIESANDDVYKIPKEHKADLAISIKQKQEGKTVPNELVNQRFEKWLYR